MKPIRTSFVLVLCAAAGLLCGCIAPKSFVDVKFREALVTDLKPKNPPVLVTIDPEFQINGKVRKAQEKLVRLAVSKALESSGVMKVAAGASSTPAGQLRVVVNNVADLGDAAGKGFVTGLTFGAAGSEVVDGYEATLTYTPPGGASTEHRYRHAIHTVIGSHEPPANMEPLPLSQAFDRVVQDMVFNFIRDLQREGIL